jgi:SAM-dependent methyltransferase
VINGVRNESLERLTFADESVDVHVTQDVFEHLFDFELAAREIARTLRPDGLHIFTAPVVRKQEPTVHRARQRPDGTIEHLLPPTYHGNPIDPGGSLVVWDFGFDLADRIHATAGTPTTCYVIDDLERGIRAEYIEVFASRKQRPDR